MVAEITLEEGKGDTVEYLAGEEGTMKILKLGVMGSPVVVAEGRVVMVGYVPDKLKVREKIYGK